MPMPGERRTQGERRESTIARLIDATITSLATVGFARTTTTRVCQEAGLSQGALFRHFAQRVLLIEAATEEVCRRHVALLDESLQALQGVSLEDPVRALVLAMREQARSAEHAAWHEVMVAARCDAELHSAVARTLRVFEAALLERVHAVLANRFGARSAARRERLGTIMLSLMHIFDSEAVTTAVYRNRALEEDRVEWLTQILRVELADH